MQNLLENLISSSYTVAIKVTLNEQLQTRQSALVQHKVLWDKKRKCPMEKAQPTTKSVSNFEFTATILQPCKNEEKKRAGY